MKPNTQPAKKLEEKIKAERKERRNRILTDKITALPSQKWQSSLSPISEEISEEKTNNDEAVSKNKFSC